MCWAIRIQMFQATLQPYTDYTGLILKRNLGTERLLTQKFIIFYKKKNETGEKNTSSDVEQNVSHRIFYLESQWSVILTHKFT